MLGQLLLRFAPDLLEQKLTLVLLQPAFFLPWLFAAACLLQALQRFFPFGLPDAAGQC